MSLATLPLLHVYITSNILLSHHYLDDVRLAEKEIAKQLNQCHGASRIKQELRQKGLDPLVVLAQT